LAYAESRRAYSAQVQRKLSAPRQLRSGDLEIAGELFPLEGVCGDLVTMLELPAGDKRGPGRIVFAIGDIAGKGLQAGMWFTHVLGLIRLFATTLERPAAIAAAINSHLAALQPEPPLTSLFLGSLEPGTGEVKYCNAGHPSPVMVRRAGGIERLGTGGPLLGAVAGIAYGEGTTELGAGDTLVGYSDGLVECRNQQGEDFGVERVAWAARAAGNSASSTLFSVLGAAQDFAAAHPRRDDLALIVVRDCR
jgi:serine phosphatase RsbU (regulator of sigma subunit)